MRFIRKNGRTIPIRDDKNATKERVKGTALAVGGSAASILGSNKVHAAISKRFGSRLGIAGMLGTIFVGEAFAAEGIDRFTESLGLKRRTEQNVKNVAGGTVGVLGAVSALRKFRR